MTKSKKTENIQVENDFKLSTRVVNASNTVKIRLNTSDWVFSQISGISSVILDDRDNYTVTSETIDHINENENAWSNEILEKYYKTFICGHNFLEHDQDESKSYGFIADAKIRDVELDNGKVVKYVDLLIATAKRLTPNDNIAKEIESGKRNKWSMGCTSSSVICSKCGNVSSSDENDCDHIKYNAGKKYITKYGYQSKIAIIVSNLNEGDDINEPTGWIKFIEMSSVSDPAFKGAVSSHILKTEPNKDIYFSIDSDHFNRKEFNGVKKWINKGLVTVVK